MMKKNYLWLFAILFVAAFALTACGSDDDETGNGGDGDTPPPTPTSVVGTWDAFIKWSNPDDMALRYSHKLTYVFNQDGTFKIRTIYGQGESSEQFQGEETVVFTGKYVANNGKLQFRNVTYVMIMWDNTRERGSMYDLTLNYSLSGNTLTIASDDPNMVRFGHHHILVSTLKKSSGDIDDDKTPEITEANLKGTWDGKVDHDFAQSYYQRWRIQFDGKNYIAWHTHQMVGTTNDEVQGLKTVGNKQEGTWEYTDGKLVLTPAKMWASYYLTAKSMNDPMYYVYHNYNQETMESDPWYETSEASIKAGIERDLEDGINGNESYISAWPVVGLTKTELSIRINRDVFKLEKQ